VAGNADTIKRELEKTKRELEKNTAAVNASGRTQAGILAAQVAKELRDSDRHQELLHSQAHQVEAQHALRETLTTGLDTLGQIIAQQDAALERIAEAVENPRAVLATENRKQAAAHIRAGQLERAERSLLESLEADATVHDTYLGLAYVYGRQDNLAKLIETLETAFGYLPPPEGPYYDSHRDARVVNLQLLARAFAAQGDYGRAVLFGHQAAENALVLSDSWPVLLLELSRYFVMAGEAAAVPHVFFQVVEQDPAKCRWFLDDPILSALEPELLEILDAYLRVQEEVAREELEKWNPVLDHNTRIDAVREARKRCGVPDEHRGESEKEFEAAVRLRDEAARILQNPSGDSVQRLVDIRKLTHGLFFNLSEHLDKAYARADSDLQAWKARKRQNLVKSVQDTLKFAGVTFLLLILLAGVAWAWVLSNPSPPPPLHADDVPTMESQVGRKVAMIMLSVSPPEGDTLPTHLRDVLFAASYLSVGEFLGIAPAAYWGYLVELDDRRATYPLAHAHISRIEDIYGHDRSSIIRQANDADRPISNHTMFGLRAILHSLNQGIGNLEPDQAALLRDVQQRIREEADGIAAYREAEGLPPLEPIS
jgi:tetratricopeptide (TPR) repeat protein